MEGSLSYSIMEGEGKQNDEGTTHVFMDRGSPTTPLIQLPLSRGRRAHDKLTCKLPSKYVLPKSSSVESWWMLSASMYLRNEKKSGVWGYCMLE